MQIPMDRVPMSLEEAVEIIVGSLDDSERDFILEHTNHAEIHHTFGQHIRNAWSLWDLDTILVTHFKERFKIGHADDISGMICSHVWSEVYGVPIYSNDIVKRYHKHWKKMGVDPVTLKRLEGD